MKLFIVIILILLNILLIIKIKYERKNFSQKNTEITWEKQEIAYSLYKNYIYENHKVYTNDSIHYKSSGIVDTNYKLFFKIPVSYCDACIRPMLKELQSLTEEFDKEKIIIVTSFPTTEEIIHFKKSMNLTKLTVINLPENAFTLDMKELIGAYIFLLNKDMKAKNIFFCSKFNSFCISSYLKAIKSYLAK